MFVIHSHILKKDYLVIILNVYADLLTKSNQNHKTAEYAQENKFYDIAVSRYYYCLFQLIDFILYNKKENYFIPEHVPPHNYTIEQFNALMYRKFRKALSDEEIADVVVLENLKKWRQIADYKNKMISESEFNNDFMKKFSPCYTIINEKILSQVV